MSGNKDGSGTTKVIKFETVWKNYPEDHPCVDKNGAVPFGYDNQCAMRVGVALELSGVSFASFGGGRCPVGPFKGGMIANAQQLADWLRSHRFPGLAPVVVIAPATEWETTQGQEGDRLLQGLLEEEGRDEGNGVGGPYRSLGRIEPDWISGELSSVFSRDLELPEPEPIHSGTGQPELVL